MFLRLCPILLILISSMVLLTANVSAADSPRQTSPTSLELKAGDRVVFIGNTFADQLRLNNYLETLLTSQAAVPGLTFRNLAWSGDTLKLRPRPLNFGSLDDHLKAQQADVIIACFGMNESFDGAAGLADYTEAWEQFLQHLTSQKFNGKSAPRVVIISPIAHENMGSPLPDPFEHNQSLAKYTQAMLAIAERHQIPFVDLYARSKHMMQENVSQKLTRNGIHLNEYGYWALSQFVAEQLLGRKLESPSVVIDVSQKQIQVTYATVTDSKFQPDQVEFTILAETLPLPAPPKASIPVNELLEKQPRLTVKNLPEGKYRLLVNGIPVTEARHSDWSRGLQLQALPSQARVDDLRASIDRKNELFFYVYRAHNAEYVFGRRTKPFGAVSFPPEMETFGKLIEARETTIKNQARPLDETKWGLFRVD
ncbi:SGNH/GDSL hydrolase family protein [Gimesia algae]|uniref:GDSL-like Lipase/Acylhydrolase n=1 Tax=Gimesia algae TaxID=2527971 RepID=A0A517VKD9_9PLAN|nr:SGNH/GDSL hydrolase family protein [Gimesia algae]QDT93483.1 GDSL-like Lipase/Acylhydrolase [Gimesia algae]